MKLISWALSAILVVSPFAAAETGTASTQREVGQLLDFVGHSDCKFKRNGVWYDALEARAHLRKKFEYLDKRGKISDAESFIQLAASKSSISGQPYQVRCDQHPEVPSAVWLTEELKHLRGTR